MAKPVLQTFNSLIESRDIVPSMGILNLVWQESTLPRQTSRLMDGVAAWPGVVPRAAAAPNAIAIKKEPLSSNSLYPGHLLHDRLIPRPAALVIVRVEDSGLRVGELVVFAGYPAGAIFKDFFFPDGDNFFNPVNHFIAGVEGLIAVR